MRDGRAPDELARERLWPFGAPDRFDANWAAFRSALSESHWKPWLNWYQRRLDGTEFSVEIELLFATLPVDPHEKDPAEQNSLLAAEIERLSRTESRTPEPSGADIWDFFISYATEDETYAKEVALALKEAGYSSFAQFKDIGAGDNFVCAMRCGLKNSRRVIALLSPDYEASDHCQHEWTVAYNRHPSGSKRILVQLLVRETELDEFLTVLVYKSLVGLTKKIVRPRSLPRLKNDGCLRGVGAICPATVEWLKSFMS